MKIESAASEDGYEVFSIELELSENTGLHEAHVALNAIAARNRAAFEVRSFDEWTNPQPEMLVEATEDFLQKGMDKFLTTIQRIGREKAREGYLDSPIHLRATAPNLDYLHQALLEYKLSTGAVVSAEMKNAMGNQAGMTRTLEAVVADPMIQRIEAAIEVSNKAEPVTEPLGFGRVLLESHEA